MMSLKSQSLKIGLVFALGSLAIGQFTPAVANPKPMQPGAEQIQPNQMNERFEGKVEQYLLNREGVVDGLLLSDGVQVRFAPHLSSNVLDTVKVGDTVIIMGDAGVASSMGQEVRAYSITNGQTERTVVDQPPTTPPTRTTPMNYSTLSVEGTAKHWLVGQQGEINGLILSDGTQIKFSP